MADRQGTDPLDVAAVGRIEQDTGPDLPATERGKIFQRFYCSAVGRQTQGSGRGLSLAAAIAKLHDATVSVHPAATGGSRCDLLFPAAMVD